MKLYSNPPTHLGPGCIVEVTGLPGRFAVESVGPIFLKIRSDIGNVYRVSRRNARPAGTGQNTKKGRPAGAERPE